MLLLLFVLPESLSSLEGGRSHLRHFTSNQTLSLFDLGDLAQTDTCGYRRPVSLPLQSSETANSRNSIYQLRFGLRTGAGEPVEVKSLEVTTTGTGDKSLVTGRLYIDHDNDGFIDSDGPGLQPVATGKFNLDTGVLDLGDGLVLEPDQEFNFILTYKVDLSGLLLMQAGIPLVLLLLSLLLVSRKRPVISAGLVGLFVLTVMGCSSQDDFVFRNTNVQQQSETTTPTGPIAIRA